MRRTEAEILLLTEHTLKYYYFSIQVNSDYHIYILENMQTLTPLKMQLDKIRMHYMCLSAYTFHISDQYMEE